VINYKLVAVAKRTPAMVIGDGFSTIQKLIDAVNSDPERGEGHEKVLTQIRVDAVTQNILRKKNYTLDSILPIGEILFLKDTANLSTGGTSTDVTDLVHPENLFLAERIAKLVNLDICGIDIVSQDISLPVDGRSGAVIEVNAGPGFRMHLSPSKGLPRNVAEPVLDMLYPEGKAARIPLVAITGTNGKTTTTRLIAHIAKTAGKKVGFTTTDGIYIHDRMITAGDCTGSRSAGTVLSDPTVDFAVLETARGGILRTGLGFDHCDISIVTNISEDHLGLKGIRTMDEMARVKEVVPRSTFDKGYAILNADDDLVYRMRENLYCNIALFSMNPSNPRIREHCNEGGMAAVVEKGHLTICKGEWKIRICKIESIPITFEGKADFMTKNVLPAALSAIISNFRVEDIRNALQTFKPSPEQTPGRLNVFRFRNFEVMIDYAHNPGGMTEMKQFLSRVNKYKTGVITGVGDRRDTDIRTVGSISAGIFDEIVIKHDQDLRGRPAEDITRLLREGIESVQPAMTVNVVSDELDALRFAMENAPRGSLVILFADKIKKCIEFLNEELAHERENFGRLDSLMNTGNHEQAGL
jgi:cyanophycin synthetase